MNLKKKFIIRLDDISWDMNYEKFSAVRDILIENEICPLIGVIPMNEDKELKGKIGTIRVSKEDFWNEIRKLNREYKWDISLHGFNHVYVTKGGGILKKNQQSEFAGLSYNEQFIKIKKGIEILSEEGISPVAFMAPSHSFDKTTIQALKDNNLNCITDGYSLYPFYEDEVLFVPQLRSYPKLAGIGIDTICYHTNSMKEQDINALSNFISQNRSNIISFKHVVLIADRSIPWQWKVINRISKIGITIIINLRRVSKTRLSRGK